MLECVTQVPVHFLAKPCAVAETSSLFLKGRKSGEEYGKVLEKTFGNWPEIQTTA